MRLWHGLKRYLNKLCSLNANDIFGATRLDSFFYIFFNIHYIILRTILRIQPLGYSAIVLYI